jgi:esterase/lipase superfamily enzyme
MRLVLASILLAGVGCSRTLPAAPNLYVNSGGDPFAAVPPALRSSTIEVLYATDRLPEEVDGDQVTYGTQRSPVLEFGVATVEVGRDLSWDELVDASSSRQRTGNLAVTYLGARSLVSFPMMPEPSPVLGLDADATALDMHLGSPDTQRATAELHASIERALAMVPRREVVVFVHGFNNTFPDAVSRMAETWHYLGRQMVPIVYSWPAGREGLFGYDIDYESSRFTVSHFKRLMIALMECDAVEKIHIIAHSRGTDVVTSAVREGVIHFRAAGKDPKTEIKIGHLVLAAADLDLEMVNQRLRGERVEDGCEHVTVYSGAADKALQASTDMHGSALRLGQVSAEKMPEWAKLLLWRHPQVSVVQLQKSRDFIGHSYFIDDPAALSDLILLLRYDRLPGAENGRPLERDESGIWTLGPEYPVGVDLP